MFYSKSFALIGGVALAVAPTIYTEAFTTTITSTISPSRARSPLCALMIPSDDDGAVSESRRNFGFATAASAVALLFPSSANAVEIVTMDMSMPGSYGSLSDPLASGKEELTQKAVVNTGASRKKAAPSGASAKEQAKAARAERVAERLEREQGQAAKDEQSAKERDENIRRVREEKAAQRAATQAEKQAANDAANEDAKYKGAKFVDTSMPTY